MSNFRDVIGHDSAIRHLKRALQDGLVSHAYIIEGSKGVGKRTLADAFIHALLCENPHADADGVDSCGTCDNCVLLDHGNHPDVIYLRPEEGKKAISVQQIRAGLVSDIEVYPYRSASKVYVIENADQLGIPAQNAMLKTIEEPPAYAVVLLLCENAASLLPTILSRCVKISLQPLPGELVETALTSRGISREDAGIYASFAQGCLGQALALSQDETFASLRSDLFTFLGKIPHASPLDVLKGASLFSDYKASEDTIFDLLEIWQRDVSVFHETGDASLLLCRDHADDIKAVSAYYTSDKIARIGASIRDIRKKMKQNANPGLAIDCLMISLK